MPPPDSSLSVLQAVELLRSKPPRELAAAELQALADLVERNPACCTLLGGREHVERYLAEARAARHERKSAPQRPAEATSGPSELATAPTTGFRYGTLLLLTLFASLLMLVLLVAGAVVLLKRPVADHPPGAEARPALINGPALANGPAPAGKPKQPSATADPSAKAMHAAAPRSAPLPDVAKPLPAAVEKKPEMLHGGWAIETSPETVIVRKTEWLLDDPANPRPGMGYAFGAHPVTISATRQIDPEQRWLRIRLAPLEGWEPAGTIEVRVDGRPVARAALEPAMLYVPVLASLEPYVGKQVRLELRYEPANTRAALSFKAIDLVAHQSRVEWTPLPPIEATALFGAALKTLPDHSLLASGVDADNEVYRVTVALPPQGASAIRLEAIPDASLPEQGPGRGSGGSFLLAQVSAKLPNSTPAKDKIRARHVKVFGVGRSVILSLAEVEVFSGGQNVALKKNATQSSVAFDAPAALAVDGNHSGDFNLKTVTHSRNEPVTWWSVDLGADFDIDRVAVWNRTDCLSDRLADHRVQLLDAGGQVLWECLNPLAPYPQAVYGPFGTGDKRVFFTGVTVGGRTAAMNSTAIVDWDHPGIGSNNPSSSNASTAVFHLAGEPTLKGERLTIELTQGGRQFKRNLGRFRLTSTTAAPPYEADPPVYILPAIKP